MFSRLIPAVLLLCASLHSAAIAQTPISPKSEVGFRRTVTPAGVEVGVWYPAEGTPTPQRLGLYSHQVVVDAQPIPGHYPLIVMSHGTGGSYSGHVDTAVALAQAGFIVAALTHRGDNWQDNSRATQIEARPKALSRLITYMLYEAPERAQIDRDHIGAFGFSAGGFTVLAAAGGQPDFSRLVDHCKAHPAFFDCQMIGTQPRKSAPERIETADKRIKVLVVAAPALGFTFADKGLEQVRIPVQLWRADQDEILPAPYYADVVREALPVKPEFHSVPNAGHFDFLAPCIEVKLAPQICTSRPGFNRTAFHSAFNAEVVRFFNAHLR